MSDLSRQQPPTPQDLARYHSLIDGWFAAQEIDHPLVDAVERDVFGPRQWFVRLLGEEKGPFTIRFELDQRTLRYETYFCPAAEENLAEFHHHLLVRNASMYGASFCIRDEGAVYLKGQLGLSHGQLIAAEVVDEELDRILGSLYTWAEQYFRPAMRIGFASRFKG